MKCLTISPSQFCLQRDTERIFVIMKEYLLSIMDKFVLLNFYPQCARESIKLLEILIGTSVFQPSSLVVYKLSILTLKCFAN